MTTKKEPELCRWTYKDGKTCTYVGDLARCDKTYSGPMGCTAHSFYQDVTGGRPFDPAHFGGLPRLPKD